MAIETKRAYRQDTIPFVSNGCKHHSDCFTCPFPEDRLPCDGFVPKSNRVNIEKAQQLEGEGLGIPQIAEKLGKSIRTIQRYLNNDNRNKHQN